MLDLSQPLRSSIAIAFLVKGIGNVKASDIVINFELMTGTVSNIGWMLWPRFPGSRVVYLQRYISPQSRSVSLVPQKLQCHHNMEYITIHSSWAGLQSSQRPSVISVTSPFLIWNGHRGSICCKAVLVLRWNWTVRFVQPRRDTKSIFSFLACDSTARNQLVSSFLSSPSLPPRINWRRLIPLAARSATKNPPI
ncbi:hypothetical protein BJX64DRAFT_120345 [Aspergillus heterothallicus]